MPEQSPTIRLREIVEARRSSAAASLLYAETGRRALDVLTDPAFVEKVARALCEAEGFVADEPWAPNSKTPAWQAWKGDAAVCLSLLAAHALGEG